MDMLLVKSGEGAQVRPLSIHGMLWLQTHFESQHWEVLASSKVQLPSDDANALFKDAEKAGIQLSYFSEVSQNQKLKKSY